MTSPDSGNSTSKSSPAGLSKAERFGCLALAVLVIGAILFVIFVLPAKIYEQGPASGADEKVVPAADQVPNSAPAAPSAPASPGAAVGK